MAGDETGSPARPHRPPAGSRQPRWLAGARRCRIWECLPASSARVGKARSHGPRRLGFVGRCRFRVGDYQGGRLGPPTSPSPPVWPSLPAGLAGPGSLDESSHWSRATAGCRDAASSAGLGDFAARRAIGGEVPLLQRSESGNPSLGTREGLCGRCSRRRQAGAADWRPSRREAGEQRPWTSDRRPPCASLRRGWAMEGSGLVAAARGEEGEATRPR